MFSSSLRPFLLTLALAFAFLFFSVAESKTTTTDDANESLIKRAETLKLIQEGERENEWKKLQGDSQDAVKLQEGEAVPLPLPLLAAVVAATTITTTIAVVHQNRKKQAEETHD
eukprot:TRINITY_DN5668_c0_g1_i2.p1 TRINITY_DN5668_c0_g1~~TRINITY_DN5668_c0_g1_i2.p1  ORF type:complete len:114 (-),score=36.04 TRINITY_DN5668_c0_g1_i2:279-620(-)